MPVSITEVLKRIEQGDGFAVVSFDFEVSRLMLQLPHEWEIHGRIIAVTASHYKATLITKDQVLQASDQVKTIW